MPAPSDPGLPLTAIRLPVGKAAGAILAAWDAGRAVLPVDPASPPAEASTMLSRLRPTHVSDEGGTAPRPSGVSVSEDIAAVVTTSGTTGEPQGVELTWHGLRASAAAVSTALGVTATDRWLCCLPVHHAGGLAVLARAWATGIPLDVLPAFEPSAVARTGATLVSLVPTMLRRALGHPDGRSCLRQFRRVLVGGAPVAPDLKAQAEEAGVSVVATYGLTETWGGVVHDGHLLAQVEARIAGDGEILLRCPMMMRGYRLAEAHTAAVLSEDGWLRTGDTGVIDGEGRLTIVDRLRDLIVSGGVSVSPVEVDSVLTMHPQVSDVCVAGAPDPEWGERVVAYVVPADGGPAPSLDDLRRFGRRYLSPPKLPRQLIVVEAIPRNPAGKPLRRLLRDSSKK